MLLIMCVGLTAIQSFAASVGDWVCLRLDVNTLTSEVKFEAPAPVGNVAPPEGEERQLFPHIYGPINTEAVTGTFPVQRGEDGSFLSITGV